MVENYKFELYVRRWGRICITVPNLNKIGQAVFKMAAVRHLGFVKFKYFNGRSGQGNHFASYTKFHKDRSNSGGDIAIFVIFQDGGCRHLGFQ